ncbi:benzoate/H(+) symporter BenE family transporter [Vallitalea sp.]|jgi:benzoate membrane transport protein|uniref:benzoate/H(+) symporter BenE family transporter n=1 Tax=Vallitalea sp. TaxID=1882829 RepID=UPI0025DD7A9F|nr:solute carrier family 23 protein [Vallitalea sp.]MCT4685914.1 benzoate/H(+) symporter BenE family transporter [Vallitalea sp.]
MNNNSIIQGIKDLPKHLNSKTISSGVIAGIFGWCTALILFANGNACGWSMQETSSWIFACWVFGPILGIILSLKYKEPIPGAWSISGAAIVVSGAGAGYSLQQLCTGFLLAGILVLILGVTGLISKVMKFLPMPIVMGMTAGCLFKFVTNMVNYIFNWSSNMSEPNYGKYLLIALFAIVAWLIFTKLRPVIKVIPPILAAFAVVIICVFAFGLYDASALEGIKFYGPKFIGYSFENVGGVFVSVSLPLALLVIGAENAQAIGVLKSQDYEPPVKSMTIWSGIGGVVTSLFGGHNANIAGPMTAIVASEESGDNKDDRYAAAVVCGIWCSIIGIFASLLVPFLSTMPLKLIYLVAGLAMVGVILSSLQSAFKANKFQVSAFFAFFIALSQKSFLGIGSAFWALLVGIIIAAVLETKDLKTIIDNKNRN